MQLLNNKVALITGANSGIGRATALLFARHGARVVLAARRSALLEEVVRQIRSEDGDAVHLAGDVRDEEFAAALVGLAANRYGGLDIAINNAATMGPIGATTQISLRDWQLAIETNLTAAFLGAKFQIPAMTARGGGSLVFVGTFVGHTVGLAGIGAYAASKSGLIGLTQTLAAEFGAQRVRVNALLPGGTETPMAMIGTPEQRKYVEGLHALGRIAQPEEIAQSALYLASDLASFTTGTALLADGGVSIFRG